MIVRWGIGELTPLVRELSFEHPLLVTSKRWRDLDLPIAWRFDGVRRHAPLESVAQLTEIAIGADALIALGGGSAIDTAKAVSAQHSLPVISVPTTYSGAEWTDGFGMRDERAGVKRGGAGARLRGIVYEPRLTFGLPINETVGTALNALAHCAEALYASRRNDLADRDALTGAQLLAQNLATAVELPNDLEARTALLKGAMHAGRALGSAGMALAHAMAQALGGRYGVSHGVANALCLPPVLRFNAPVAAYEVESFAEAIGATDPAAGVERLASLGPVRRLRDLEIPEHELVHVAAAAATRPGALANPRHASEQEILQLLRSIW